MLRSLKELFVVLVITLVIFRLARPLVLLFVKESDFVRRRNVWCALTAAAFLSPNFWIYALVAMPLLLWAARKESNPAALYLLLLHVIPPYTIRVPMVGISFLFDADNYLILSFCLMTPAALHLLSHRDTNRIRGLQAMDFFLFAYGILNAFLFVHPETAAGTIMSATFSDCLRRMFLFFFVTIVPYFVISRSISDRRAMLDLMATYCLMCCMLAAVAIFETEKHWLLYGEMADLFASASNYKPVSSFSAYLERGATLRAMVSTGHSLVLGYLLAIGLGFWLYLQTHVKSKAARLSVTALILLGLLAAYSRGPWFGALCIYIVFVALKPGTFSRFFKAVGVAVGLVALISLTPLREKIVTVLPFLGGMVDNQDLLYRHRLFDRAWGIIQEHPFLGDQNALLRMQDLRQGQGIIDMVNSYLGILLDDGFVGLFLVLTFISIAILKAWALTRDSRKTDPDLSTLGASLLSCIVATLLMMLNGGFGGGSGRMFYVLAALAAAYVYLGRAPRVESRSGARQQVTA
jgi:O-antigen ligase